MLCVQVTKSVPHLTHNLYPEFRLRTHFGQPNITQTDYEHPFSKPPTHSSYQNHRDVIYNKSDFPLTPEAEEDLRSQEENGRRSYKFNDDGSRNGDSKPYKSRRKRVIIAVVVIGIFLVGATAAVALPLTLLQQGEV